jgi:hypothetical protein
VCFAILDGMSFANITIFSHGKMIKRFISARLAVFLTFGAFVYRGGMILQCPTVHHSPIDNARKGFFHGLKNTKGQIVNANINADKK